MAQLKHPQILFANDLKDGEVLFLGAKGWVRDHRIAKIAATSEEIASMQAVAAVDLAANRVLDVYPVDVTLSPDGHPEPIHYREKMRTLGPSMRLDLGKQANGVEFGDI